MPLSSTREGGNAENYLVENLAGQPIRQYQLIQAKVKCKLFFKKNCMQCNNFHDEKSRKLGLDTTNIAKLACIKPHLYPAILWQSKILACMNE